MSHLVRDKYNLIRNNIAESLHDVITRTKEYFIVSLVKYVLTMLLCRLSSRQIDAAVLGYSYTRVKFVRSNE